MPGRIRLNTDYPFASPYQSQTDVANTIPYPFQLVSGQYGYNNYVSINKEDLTRTQFGPSLGFRLTDRLSVGATLYYVRDTRSFMATDEYELLDKTTKRELIMIENYPSGFNPFLDLYFLLPINFFLECHLERL